MKLIILTFLAVFLLLDSPSNAQTTSIPDSNFEQSLIDQGIDSDGVLNGKVLTSDVTSITYLDVSGNDIIQLTGIQDFINLTELHCQENLLNSLTLVTNTKMEVLNCSENQLPSLSLKDLTKLRVLKCSFNKISEINLSGNELLEEFYCDHNSLSTLNLKNNLELIYLNCSSNQFDVLNITFNWKLKYLDFSSNLLEYIDLSNGIKLEYMDGSNNPLTSVFLNNMTELQMIHLNENKALTDIDFSHNYNLETIVCHDNESLTNIKLSAAVALKYLDCSNNSLTELQTVYNPLLENLYCQKNQIKELDLSQNMNLAFLKCNDNQLEFLDLKNGSNHLMTGGETNYDGQWIYLDGLDATNNPALVCIQVDNEFDANLGHPPYDTWMKDESTSYSENCEVNLGIEEQLLNDSIQIFPNPAQNMINVSSDNQQVEKIIIYSVLGRSIAEYNSQFDQISLNTFSPGIYLMRIHSDKGVVVKRFIKN